jgi:MFS family permease
VSSQTPSTTEPEIPATTTNPADPGPTTATEVTETTEAKPRTLWRDNDFLKLWTGESLALLGAQVSRVALPLVAVVMLNANAAQMGVLNALAQLPFLLFLFAGVWADRVRRRPTMIWTDLSRFVLLGMIPVLYLAGQLSMGWLFAVAFALGVLGVLFEVAYQAYLPSLVGREYIGEGNQKLQLSNSVAQVAGPSVAGLLVSAISAALVLIASTVTYLASAVALMFIRKPEPPPSDGQRQNVVKAIGSGLGWVVRHRVLRPIVVSTSLFMFFNTGLQTLFVLYMIRELEVPAGWVGGVFAAAGPGAIVGSWLALRAMKRFGLGPSILWSVVVANSVLLLIPLAFGPLWMVIGLLALSQFVFGLAGQIGVVNQTTLRMVLTPDALQGRVVASFRAISLSMVPVGALAFGLLAEFVGLRPTVLIAAIGVLLPIVVYLSSPIPGIREFPSEEQAAAWAPAGT